jgi:hypothetical protein
MTQEWQNGDINLLAQDKALIQGTTLTRLLQMSQEHKLAWLAQIRLARLAYATVQDDGTPTGTDADANEQHTPHEHCREVTISIAFMHHQSSPSSICSRNRPSVCIHNINHHKAAGSGRQIAHHHHHHPLVLEKLHLGQQDLAVSLSLSLGNQPFGIAVGKP